MPQSDIDIVNAALRRIGSSPILDLDEDTALANQAVPAYGEARDECFAAYEWSFAVATRQASRAALTPENGWTYAYVLPGNMIGQPRRVLDDPRDPGRPLRRYALEEGHLFADVEQVWITALYAVSPDLWPPPFRAAVVALAASRMAITVTQQASFAAELRQEAVGSPAQGGTGGLLGRAILLDAQHPGPAPLGEASPLARPRRDFPWYGRY